MAVGKWSEIFFLSEYFRLEMQNLALTEKSYFGKF